MEHNATTIEAAYVWPVKKPEDLTPAQRECAGDIIDAFHKAIRFGIDPMIVYMEPLTESRPLLITEKADEVYWDGVFDDWNTSKKIPEVHLASWVPSPKDLRHPVGHFKQDLPPSKCAQRNAKKTAKNTPQARPERRKGAPAYLRARYKSDSKHQFEWEFCDATGKGADLSHVAIHITKADLTVQQSIQEHKAAALERHDRIIASNAFRFNREYLRYLMRCRLMRILSDTVPQRLFRQRPSNPTRTDLGKFWRPDLIEVALMKRPSTGERARMQMCAQLDHLVKAHEFGVR